MRLVAQRKRTQTAAQSLGRLPESAPGATRAGTHAQRPPSLPIHTPTRTIAAARVVAFTDLVYDAGVEVAAAKPSAITAAAAGRPATPGSGRLVRNVLVLAGGQLASWLFGLCWTLVVPRRLGPAAMGEFVIAISTAAVLGIIVSQGASPLLTRDIARDNSKASELVGGAIVMRLAITVPACVGMLIYIHVVGFGADRALLIWLATALFITAAVSSAFEATFSGLERMEYLAYAGLVGNGLASLLGIALVLLGGRVVAVMVLNLSLTVLVLALNVYWARRVFAIAWRGATRVVPHLLRAGFSFWIGGLFFTGYLWIDSILLSILVPARVVGWYGVPTQLFVAILMVVGVMGTAWFPRFATAYIAGGDSLRRSARPAVEAAVVLSLPLAVGTALVAAPLVALLYGNGFAGAVPVLTILGACIVPTFLNMMAYQILQAEGRQVSWFKVIAIATALNVAANLVLIPHFQAQGNGAVGAALSLLGTEVFELVAAIVLLPWLLSAALLGRAARAAAATGLMAASVFAVSPAGLFAEVAAGLATFGIFALILRVPTSSELALLRGFGARLRSRLMPPATTP
jgi:O-antigen/teichoic acid export membrane protein